MTAAEIQAIRSIAAEQDQPYAAFARLCDEVERLLGIEHMMHDIVTAKSDAEKLAAARRLVSASRSGRAVAA